ncbi:MAG: endolytic transglycosylase MltG [Dehalococcoidia bacterium]
MLSVRGLVATVLVALIGAAAWFGLQRVPAVIASAEEVPGRGPSATSEESVVIRVPSGADGSAIARQMRQAGVISDAGLFRTLAALRGVQNQLAAGEYEFTRGTPVSEAIERVRIGVTDPAVVLTLPEGWRLEQMARLVEQRGLGSAEAFREAVAAERSESFLQSRPAGASLEGYLFPDTYFFSKKATARDVVARMLKTFDERYNADLRAAAAAHGLSVHEAVTLASIVEREAQVADERPVIAAVFINRLKAGMPLQADPTVQYAVAADPASVAQHGWWKRDLTVDDLKIQSPYSTYAQRGLPPGPIASPGLAALRAVSYPAPVKYLFFVARGDGSHAFAETLDEHNRNVQRFQR